MKLYKISTSNFEALYQRLGAQGLGAKILAKKSNTHTIYIKDLHTGAANILKQDALSIGADLAVPKGTILNTTKTVDAILIANDKHLEILSKKEQAQPFGLKDISFKLKEFITKRKVEPKIMGIVNITDDSFYIKSRFNTTNAIQNIKNMIQDGANIIDIGAISSRPGSKTIDEQEELQRIKPICDLIKKEKLYNQVDFSIDSYTPCVVEYALKLGFTYVNDITGLQDDNIASLVAQYDVTIIIMHMQGTPSTMQDDPQYDDIILDIDSFFENRIKKAKSFGINKIILDVGIGFGKNVNHNLTLLKNIEHFLHFGYELLLGASRKSIINDIVPNTKVEDRLSGTLSIHLDSLYKGVSIIRCHDVQEHYQAIGIFNKIML